MSNNFSNNNSEKYMSESLNLMREKMRPAIKTIQTYQKMVRPVTEISQKYQAMVRPIAEISRNFQKALQPLLENLKKYSDAFANALRPLHAINKLADAQYVYWEHMSKEVIDTILSSKNINKTLRELNEKSKYKSLNATIEKCKNNPHMQRHERVFDQSVEALSEGKRDLAIIGFISIVDGLLSDISGKDLTSIYTRAEAILNKLIQNEAIHNDDYALVTLMFTFRKTIESFSANRPFSGKEPKELNRHWIMHGRSKRRKTKLDCVKIIHLIYGVLLIDELGSK